MSTLEKSPDAFRTISEVAEDLDLPQHVLRFWETRFSQIKPLKRGGGRRYYRPDDVELLRGIRHLLYGEGYTIKGVQRILKEQGAKFVMQSWRGLPAPLTTSAPAPDVAPIAEDDQQPEPPQQTSLQAAAVAVVQQAAPAGLEAGGAETAANRPAIEPLEEPLPKGLLAEGAPAPVAQSSKSSGFRFMDRFRHDRDENSDSDSALSKDDIRRLQSTLFELLECKRVLDQAR